MSKRRAHAHPLFKLHAFFFNPISSNYRNIILVLGSSYMQYKETHQPAATLGSRTPACSRSLHTPTTLSIRCGCQSSVFPLPFPFPIQIAHLLTVVSSVGLSTAPRDYRLRQKMLGVDFGGHSCINLCKDSFFRGPFGQVFIASSWVFGTTLLGMTDVRDPSQPCTLFIGTGQRKG